MKLKAPDAVAAITCLSANWFSPIFLAAFLTMVSESAAVPPPSAEQLNAAEKWVVERVTAGEVADLSKEFPEEKNRQLSAHFLENLLMGTLSGVKLHRNGVRIIGAIIDEPIDMSNAQIPWEVWLSKCQFSSAAVFLRANFAGTVSFRDSTFKAEANFNGIKVRQLAFFDKVVFEGTVNFGGADIAGTFEAVEAQFRNEKQSANFNGMKVGDTAFFRKAVFEGTVDFILADIGVNFEAQEAQFNNKEQGAYFYGMRVGQIVSFKNAVFEGRVEFDAADIAANFEADEAQFRNKAETVRLVMKCGRQGVFKDVTFAGPVSFQDSSFLDLVIGDMKPGAPSVPRLDLSRSSIKRLLSIRKISIQDLVAPWLHVEGPADFTDITVEHSADLSYGDFSTLDLSRSIWPKDAGALDMQQMSYKQIRAAPKEPESHKALLKLAGQSAYSADVYSKLEEFFLRQGYRADADEAFTAGKVRERKEYFRSGDWFGWLRSWMLDLLVGYGRQPWQAGIPCAVLVALGCVLFSPKKMEPQNREDTPRVYNRFWYSLGLFLPFVDLQSNKVWKPKADQTFLRNYMRVHILLGWILVPLVLAAVTGLIK